MPVHMEYCDVSLCNFLLERLVLLGVLLVCVCMCVCCVVTVCVHCVDAVHV